MCQLSTAIRPADILLDSTDNIVLCGSARCWNFFQMCTPTWRGGRRRDPENIRDRSHATPRSSCGRRGLRHGDGRSRQRLQPHEHDGRKPAGRRCQRSGQRGISRRGRGRPARLPLRDLRRRAVLDRQAPPARGRPEERGSDDRAQGRAQGGRRRAAGRDPRQGRSQEPGDDRGAAQDERRRGPPGDRGREGSDHAPWRHLRALSFHGGQLGDAGHRPPERRLAEPRSERRGHHRAVPGAAGGQEGRLPIVGAREVRPALQPGRKEHPARPPARVWSCRGQERDVYGGGPDLLLECVCRGHADGRAGQLLRPAARKST